MKERAVNKIGWLASMLSMAMYLSYIDQIHLALEGHKGSLLLAITTTVNCSSWILYGILKKKKDWPIVLCNAIGFILGVITVIVTILP